MGVKSWAARLPSVEGVRPARCPGCGAASRPVGAALVLHGHGVRERQVLGPVEWGEVPLALTVGVRRFLCTSCRATCTVGPREVLTRRLYSAPAVALALALFGLLLRPVAQVRAQVSPWRVVGPSSAGSWCALFAWVRAVRGGGVFAALPPCPEDWSARRVAARAAGALAARAPEAVGPSPPPLHVLTALGAVHAR
ncbi:transposase family protein [Corallococcus exiguus]|uniref:transposase family protein n=1 Tax=Corallococcus TaxID=83461 RepID=UPI00131514CB|nr:transposase family protein [Corallococcus sp. AB032C]NNB92085.1 transposase family protein [Corallococcus exiguus]NNC07749.1 transposase family protein [Corallococcus exiguus]NPC49117.1 transposase family protein [Corallococcus exiguus]